jgi:hypothetical protein
MHAGSSPGEKKSLKPDVKGDAVVGKPAVASDQTRGERKWTPHLVL